MIRRETERMKHQEVVGEAAGLYTDSWDSDCMAALVLIVV